MASIGSKRSAVTSEIIHMNTEPQELQALRVRVEKLELENARLKRIGAVVLLVGSMVLLMGQAKLASTRNQPTFFG